MCPGPTSRNGDDKDPDPQRRPRIDLEPIPFEAQIDLTGVLALTAPGDRDRMRSWFGTQMRAFVDKHNLCTNDGWINFRALPPVN